MKFFNLGASKLLQTPNLTPGINYQHSFAEASLADFKNLALNILTVFNYKKQHEFGAH